MLVVPAILMQDGVNSAKERLRCKLTFKIDHSSRLCLSHVFDFFFVLMNNFFTGTLMLFQSLICITCRVYIGWGDTLFVVVYNLLQKSMHVHVHVQASLYNHVNQLEK